MALLAHQPAFKLALLLVAGVLFNELFHLPFILIVAAIVVCLLAMIAVQRFFKSGGTGSATLMVATLFLVLGLGAAKHSIDTQRSPMLPDSLVNKSVVLSGVVVNDPTVFDRWQRFTLKVERVVSSEGFLLLTTNVVVTLVPARKDSLTTPIMYGMTIGVKGKLERPQGQRNPGDFDARKYYEANGISFLMRAKGNENLVIFDTIGGAWYMREIVMPARRYILRWIDETTEGEERELLKGILIGEKSGIDKSVREAFTNSGTAHILAVSGSNVAVVAAFVFFLLELLRFRRAARIILTVLCLIFYMLLTGSQPPVVRATIMAGVLLMSQLFQERTQPLNGLGIAAIIILALDSRQVFDVGFQLSFAAVLSIMLMYPPCNMLINRIPGKNILVGAGRWLLKAAALSLVASVGTLPFTAIYFGKVSVIGIAANAAVVPAVGASVVLGLISICVGLINTWAGEVYAVLNSFLLFLTIKVAEFSGGLSIAYVDTFQFRWIHAVPFYLGLALLFNITSRRVVRIVLPAFLVTLNLVVFLPATGFHSATNKMLRVSVIDVGQGDAVLVQLPDGKNMLIDAGPWTPNYDAGERLVVPFLKRLGISTVDLLVASHAHADHIGGFGAVFEHMDVAKVIDSGQPQSSSFYQHYIKAMDNEGSSYHSARSGALLHESEGVRLYALYPTSTFITADSIDHHPNLNNTSVVLRLCYGDVSFLFTGDAEEEAEEEMVKVYGDFLRSTLLKTGHHGSITSSTEGLLDHVQPEIAVISVGRNNKFNHPSPVVIERLMIRGTEILRTDEDGAVILETDGHQLWQVDWK
ncbi:MAG: DNA internalization-related competence protein ComEC/Rec2 [Bacteroidota bacterium]